MYACAENSSAVTVKASIVSQIFIQMRENREEFFLNINEPNTKVEIGDKTAEEIMDDGSMDDTTVDGSNDDEND